MYEKYSNFILTTNKIHNTKNWKLQDQGAGNIEYFTDFWPRTVNGKIKKKFFISFNQQPFFVILYLFTPIPIPHQTDGSPSIFSYSIIYKTDFLRSLIPKLFKKAYIYSSAWRERLEYITAAHTKTVICTFSLSNFSDEGRECSLKRSPG